MVVSTSAVDCLERLVSEMTYYVSSGTLNPTQPLTRAMFVTMHTVSWFEAVTLCQPCWCLLPSNLHLWLTDCLVHCAFFTGSNFSPSRTELFQDVRHLLRGPRHAAALLCVSELVGHHNSIHRHYRDGARRQQRTGAAAKDCSDTGHFCWRRQDFDKNT